MKVEQTIKWPKKNEKSTNNDLQNSIQKTINWATWTLFKTKSELGKVGSSYSDRCTIRVTLVKIPVMNHEWGKDDFVDIP